MTTKHILLIDDDSKMLILLRQVLKAEKYEIMVCNQSDKAVPMVAREQPDLVILDINLPGGVDGFEIIRGIREFSEVPLIILTERDTPEDIEHGLDAGADDYITKPFHPRIFLARLRAARRRCYREDKTSAAETEIVCNQLVIDVPSQRVLVDGSVVYLTETEYKLLLELARHRNRVLLHEQLLKAVWGVEYSSEVSYLRSYVHVLRRKLESNPSQPKLIISRPGVGYMLVDNKA